MDRLALSDLQEIRKIVGEELEKRSPACPICGFGKPVEVSAIFGKAALDIVMSDGPTSRI